MAFLSSTVGVLVCQALMLSLARGTGGLVALRILRPEEFAIAAATANVDSFVGCETSVYYRSSSGRFETAERLQTTTTIKRNPASAGWLTNAALRNCRDGPPHCLLEVREEPRQGADELVVSRIADFLASIEGGE